MDRKTKVLIGLAILLGIVMIVGTMILLSTATGPHQSTIDPSEFAAQEAMAAVQTQARLAIQSGAFSSSDYDSSKPDGASWSTSAGSDSEGFMTDSLDGDLRLAQEQLLRLIKESGENEIVLTFTVPITYFQPEGGQ